MKNIEIRISLIMVLVLWFLPLVLSGQVIKGDLNLADTTQIHRIETKRGDIFLGRITQIEGTKVSFLFNKSIELNFQLTDLAEISVITPEKAGEQYDYDKDRNEFLRKDQALHGHERGFYLPTGFLLKAGEKEYRNVGILYNSFDFGLNDNVNLGIGGVPLLLANAIHIKLRVGASIGENVHFSLNGNGYLFLAISSEVESAAFVTSAISIGKPDRNLTFGAGYGIFSEDLGADATFLLQGGAAFRVAPKFRIFGEMIVPAMNSNRAILFSGGGGWLIDNNNRLEFGFTLVAADGIVFPFPFISYAYRF